MTHPFVHRAPETPSKPRPALRLVKTHDLPREQWLEVRKGGIGSSDAAAAVGLHPYKSQLQLWMEKTGRDGNLPVVDPNDDSSPMYWARCSNPSSRRTTRVARATACGASTQCCNTLSTHGCWPTSTAR